MKSPRRRSREFVLQALYQWQLAGESASEIERQFLSADGFARADEAFFKALLKGCIRDAEALASELGPCLDRPWAEVSPIERAVLLIGGHELRALPETPYRVIINEAIELAKAFGGTDGHRYVNGVLDKFAALVRADEIGQSVPRAPTTPRLRAAHPASQKPAVKVTTRAPTGNKR